MKLTGSRSNHTFDRYSDWDYAIDERDDFAWIDTQIGAAACYRVYKPGELWILTLLKPSLEMIDCSAAEGTFDAEWSVLEGRQEQIPLSDYWIFAAKHLKGIFRGYDLLLDVGLEFSLQILRGLYLQSKLGIREYQDFFSYKTQVLPHQADLGELFAVSGMPTVTRVERIDKLMAMNDLVCALTPEFSRSLHAHCQMELRWLKEQKG
jgi:hypothetical protein